MMTVNHSLYTYRVSWSPVDEEHIGLCAEFPGLSYLADSPTEALEGIIELVGGVVRDMEQEGEAVPEPLATRKFSGKIQLRMAESTHRALAVEAAEANISINRLINAKLMR